MSYRKQIELQHCVSKTQTGEKEISGTAHQQPEADEAMQRAVRQVVAGNYQRALELLGGAGRSDRVRNTRGVCLMRLGHMEDAIRVFRELVIPAGCTWTRADLPTLYKANYATALLLGGFPNGCVEILDDIRDDHHPAVQRLQTAIKKWTKTLSWWQRFDWWLGKIAPSNRPVTLDFPPGDFDFEVTAPDATQPIGPTPDNRKAA